MLDRASTHLGVFVTAVAHRLIVIGAGKENLVADLVDRDTPPARRSRFANVRSSASNRRGTMLAPPSSYWSVCTTAPMRESFASEQLQRAGIVFYLPKIRNR